MIDHSDSTNGSTSPKERQNKLKAGPASKPFSCSNCEATQELMDETWTLLTEMKEGYEKVIELSGLNVLELEQENATLRAELARLKAI